MDGTRKQKRKVGQKTFNLDLAEVDKIVAASKERALDDSEHKVLETCQQVLTELFLREQRNNEKSKDVLGEEASQNEAGPSDKKKRKGGNGRHPREAFTNADDVDLAHPDLKPGDPCPCGCGYKLYAAERSAVFRSFRGHVPIKVTFYHRQQLKSAGCDSTFTAPLPEGIGPRHYEPSAITMFILMRYGFGLPMYRSSMMRDVSADYPSQQPAVRRSLPACLRLWKLPCGPSSSWSKSIVPTESTRVDHFRWRFGRASAKWPKFTGL